MTNQTINPITILFLKQDNIEIGLLPQLGGCIAFAKYNNIDFMRPWTGELTARRTCCYPLVPYSNRLANGQFSFTNQTYSLLKNFGDHPHSIHGVGWQQPWQITYVADNIAEITLCYQPLQSRHGWPFAFKAKQRFTLDTNSLLVEIQIQNQHPLTAPIGFGWHPFFPKHDHLDLTFQAEQVLINDSNMLPEKIIAVPKQWDFSQTMMVEQQTLDNCFINWQRQATLTWPNKQLSLSITASENLPHLVVMNPPATFGEYIAVEPVSHLNNALNASDPTSQGIQYLATNQTLSAWMKLSLSQAMS